MAFNAVAQEARRFYERLSSAVSRTPIGSLQDRYIQAMVLSGVGDALGYKNGEWEFCNSGPKIYDQLQDLGGLDKIKVSPPGWIVSDDTVMHLATGEALMEAGQTKDMDKIFSLLAAHYQKSMLDMEDRSAGATCMMGARMLKPEEKHGYRIPFNERGGGCGAAMRAMCIGLRYPSPDSLAGLIAVSVESGRMTHHHPTGYLGAVAASLFTSFAVQGKPIYSWGKALLDVLPQVLHYVQSTGHCVAENEKAWDYFQKKWEDYMQQRGISNGISQPVFPEPYGFAQRDKFVQDVSFAGWGGASGHDAPMIAYDALIAAGSNWHELCYRAMFHAGDSDSTGVMAACWYGTLFGAKHVPASNYKSLEYRKRLEKIGKGLYSLAFPEAAPEERSSV